MISLLKSDLTFAKLQNGQTIRNGSRLKSNASTSCYWIVEDLSRNGTFMAKAYNKQSHKYSAINSGQAYTSSEWWSLDE